MNISAKELFQLQKNVEKSILAAGLKIVASWEKVTSITYNDIRDVVTNVDIDVENFLQEQLSKLLPEAGFILEEGKAIKKGAYNWTIDPIDGTKHYIHHLPMFYTQVSLLEENDPVLGVVYDPICNQLFSSSRSNGCYLNGFKIVAKTQDDLSGSIIDIDFRGHEFLDWKMKVYSAVVPRCYRVRMTAGHLAPYITTGAIDAYIHFLGHDKIKNIVDLSPRISLMSESSLYVRYTEVGATKKPILLAASKPLFDKLLQIITEASK